MPGGMTPKVSFPAPTLYSDHHVLEGRVEPFNSSTAEFALYLATLLIFLAALVLILVRPLTWTGWLMGLAAGAA